ncbi:MAG TPA: hypothetical protein VF844_05420 [Ktedonobacteraceae bacterium]
MTTPNEIALEAFEIYCPQLFSVAYHSVVNPDKLAYITGQLQAAEH